MQEFREAIERARASVDVEGCDFLHTNADGLIDQFYVMVRPLSAAMALSEAMERQLAVADGAGAT